MIEEGGGVWGGENVSVEGENNQRGYSGRSDEKQRGHASRFSFFRHLPSSSSSSSSFFFFSPPRGATAGTATGPAAKAAAAGGGARGRRSRRRRRRPLFFFFRHRATLRCSPAIAVPCGPHGSPFVASSVAISSSLSFKANFLTPRTAASRALANAVPSSFRSSFLIHSIFLSSNNASQAEVGKVSFSLSLSFFFDLFFFITERN